LIREQRALLEKCAQTTLSSKLIARQREFFAKMVVDVVLMLDELLPLNMYVQLNYFKKRNTFMFRIGIKKITGGSLEESRLVAGVAFKKTFSYAGFEMQQKKYLKPKIALLNIELELKAERDNAEVRLDNVAVRYFSQSYLFI
jgi:T-complex protein 1 subunit eta